ncbi:hypothetical protein HKBW3S42_00277 [Candidatus Hakubella thermalkaliphila]|uniref:Uncharacterized protein n=1 Tax=Candidatus Hakubella thermalkaliphila TaxID=2754717 RepID=A0A6V8PMB1_9ACTN|nr:hypothetical protein [Bacillota bacterium]GFP31971.1 hypothetical protein HKBW3S42_00277 [Candidatus Hakubella thermalkaliphila]
MLELGGKIEEHLHFLLEIQKRIRALLIYLKGSQEHD